MKTEYTVELLKAKFIATIIHSPSLIHKPCRGWRISNLEFAGTVTKHRCSAILIDKVQFDSAVQQIEAQIDDQMLADELENELHQKSFNLLGSR